MKAGATLTRRSLFEAGLAWGAAVPAAFAARVFVALGAGGLVACRAETRKPAPPEKSDVLDEALIRLARTGPEYSGRLANHAPMAVEALVALGRADAVSRWIDGYERRLEPWPRSGGRIRRDAFREALGQPDRSTDWREFFVEELREAPVANVLERWLPHLAPGIAGSAAHGLIRVSHAVRALAQRETEPRRYELASALAYWATSFHRLPDEPGDNAKLTVDEALARIELVPEERRGGGSIVDRLQPLNESRSFRKAADLVDVSGDASVVLSALTRAFARVYCANAGNPDGRIARIHAVTGASALRPLLPYSSRSLQRQLLRSVWQLDAAVYATHTSRTTAASPIESFPTLQDLVTAAVDGGDEHAIKLTEVAVRENQISPDAAYFAAAAHWVRGS